MSRPKSSYPLGYSLIKRINMMLAERYKDGSLRHDKVFVYVGEDELADLKDEVSSISKMWRDLVNTEEMLTASCLTLSLMGPTEARFICVKMQSFLEIGPQAKVPR